MTLLKELLQVSRHQARNLRQVAMGLPLSSVQLGSMTLEEDDVNLALKLLRDCPSVDDPARIKEYESAFATWNGSLAAYSFLGGRVALSASIYALGLKPGDEVVVPGYTCVVVPNAFHYAGIKVVYCDIELDTWGIDIVSLESCITAHTTAILLHHLYGLVCRDYLAILDLGQRKGIRVIEDCAHATGAVYQGVRVGNRGDVGFYSSEQSKVFNTTQGGLAVTNDKQIAKRLNEYQLRAGFADWRHTERLLYTLLLNYYNNKSPQRWWRSDWANLRFGRHRVISTTKEEEQGIQPAHYGLRLPTPLAVIGLNQLNKIDRMNESRRRMAQHWEGWCIEHELRPPVIIQGSIPVYLRYPLMVKPERKSDRRWVIRELNVELGVWFCSQVHPVPREIPGCPNAVRAVQRCINLPTLMP